MSRLSGRHSLAEDGGLLTWDCWLLTHYVTPECSGCRNSLTRGGEEEGQTHIVIYCISGTGFRRKGMCTELRDRNAESNSFKNNTSEFKINPSKDKYILKFVFCELINWLNWKVKFWNCAKPITSANGPPMYSNIFPVYNKTFCYEE